MTSEFVVKPVALLIGWLSATAIGAQTTNVPNITRRPSSIHRDPTTHLPLSTSRVVRFRTTEGTWMSVDVSPDGQNITFDLLGDLYVLPMSGGHARRVTSGTAIDQHPRWSPDGKLIAFSSDRSGWDNLWVVNPSTRETRALTRDTITRYVNTPEWSRDGLEIAITFGASLPDFEVVTVQTGQVTHYVAAPTGRFNGRAVTGAVFDIEGKSLWFHSGSQWFGEKQVYRYDRNSGTQT